MRAEDHRIIPALSQAIAQGCCRGVESIDLEELRIKIAGERLDILAEALQMRGALPALKILNVKLKSTPRVLPRLAGALEGDTLPVLNRLIVQQVGVNDGDIKSVAIMLERRALIPGCLRLKSFDSNSNWLAKPSRRHRPDSCVPCCRQSYFTHIPSDATFEPYFRDVQPALLEDFCVELPEDMAAPSAEVLEALPALKKLELEHRPREVLFAKSFQPVIRALHRGVGLQALQELKFNDCLLGDGDFVAFTGALKSSGCADNLVKLWFGNPNRD